MNNKKTIIVLILILLVGIVGLTVAYFSNTTSINNLFSTNPYGTTVEEEFVSPDNWLPGDTTDKTITVTNSGSVDEAVRISYQEQWKAKDKTILSGLIDNDGNLTSNTENSEHAAIINFSDNNDWTQSNGYYYYNYRLAPGETTSSLIDSVTFNSKVKNSSNCVSSENNGTKTITCNSTQSGYDGATYTLTFTIETVQYDKYMSAWGVDVVVESSKKKLCDSYLLGESIMYNNKEYYVMENSYRNDDYIVLISKNPLTAEEINLYGENYESINGEYPYYKNTSCNENDQSGCSASYETSDINKLLDKWATSFSSDLIDVNGYKVRIMDENDIYFEKRVIPSEVWYDLSSDTPNVIKTNKMYWSNISVEDSNNMVFGIAYGLDTKYVYDKLYIRPIINIKKSVIESDCLLNNEEYKKYNFGEKIEYKNDEYYVLEESGVEKKFVTVLKNEPLTASEINEFNTNYISINGEYPYLENSTCNSNNTTNCLTDYDTSSIKLIIDSWAEKYSSDLVLNAFYYASGFGNSYKARNFVSGELITAFNYEYDYYMPQIAYPVYKSSNNTPNWAYIEGKPYWSIYNDVQGQLQEIVSNTTSCDKVYNKNYIRPVINLKKCAIDGTC